MDSPEAMLTMDPLDSMIGDADILNLMDPEETAKVLKGLDNSVFERELDIDMDTDDINNNIMEGSFPIGDLQNDKPIPDQSTIANDSLPENGLPSGELMDNDAGKSGSNNDSPSTDTNTSDDNNSETTRVLRRSKRHIDYDLRTTSIQNRIETEKKIRAPRKPKPKEKPPPLSKYRRKTANCRERTRMSEINEAFEDLRKVVPNLPPAGNGKLTKITTLHLALNYIAALREMLGYGDPLGLGESPQAQSGNESCTSPSSSTVSQSPSAGSSSDSDQMSVFMCSPVLPLGLDSEGESAYSS